MKIKKFALWPGVWFNGMLVTQDESDRFLKYTVIAGKDECWLWIGGVGSSGYGSFSFCGNKVQTHRFIYAACIGDIPDGMFVCHHCDVKLCVNPGHLFAGTQSDNMLDSVTKGRHRNQNTNKAHCKYGHEFTEANTYWYRGERCCRECRWLNSQTQYAKLKLKREKQRKENLVNVD